MASPSKLCQTFAALLVCIKYFLFSVPANEKEGGGKKQINPCQ